MSNAAQEPREWVLLVDWCEVDVLEGPPPPRSDVPEERVRVIERSAYDALLAERDECIAAYEAQNAQYAEACAERDALKAENGQMQESLSWVVLKADHDAVMAGAREAVAELKAELAALREKAERLHDVLRGVAVRPYLGSDSCLVCHMGISVEGESRCHAQDCPAHPDFLTTSATESREAKGDSNV